MIYVDYVNGLHGRFLCYCINALDPEVRAYCTGVNILSDIGTINYLYPTPLAQANHYSAHGENIPSEQTVSIVASIDDMLLVDLLYWHRINEYGFDLKNFNINFYDKVRGTYLEEMIDYFVTYGVDPRKTNTVPKQLLRQYLNNDKTPLTRLLKQDPTARYQIPFRRLYEFSTFINTISEIKDIFKIPYTIDLSWYMNFWSSYIAYVLPIIKEEADVHDLIHKIKAKENVSVDLNLVQEAWLDQSIEKLYNIKLKSVEQYYTNTQEIIDQL